MHFFEVYQDGTGRAFAVYPGANVTAPHRFMVYGSSGETTRSVGNVILTTDMIVDMGHGGENAPIRSLSSGPAADRMGRKIRWDQ